MGFRPSNQETLSAELGGEQMADISQAISQEIGRLVIGIHERDAIIAELKAEVAKLETPNQAKVAQKSKGLAGPLEVKSKPEGS